MGETLQIDCGLTLDASDDEVDISSSGADRHGKPKSGWEYTIHTWCPYPEAVNLKVELRVPDSIDLSNITSLKEAERLIVSGDVYTCNRRGTPQCPLSANAVSNNTT